MQFSLALWDYGEELLLPPGKWKDYWTGEIFDGPAHLNNYPAPLDRLPIFKRLTE
jgi:alpha-glucosidase (family GH31 glycosyl hydrolase)